MNSRSLISYSIAGMLALTAIVFLLANTSPDKSNSNPAAPNGIYEADSTTEEEPAHNDEELAVEIDPVVAEKAGIRTATAGPGDIRQTVTLYGKTMVDHGKVSHIRARFPGPIVEVAVEIGDKVEKGQLLARIESNESLQIYSLTAPFDGILIAKNASGGEYTDNRVLFTVANYDLLWAELQVFPGDSNRISSGQKVSIISDGRQIDTTIGSQVPVETGQPFVIARAGIDNRSGHWMPGLLAQGEVVVEHTKVPLVVDNRALQPFRDSTVMFIKVGDNYAVRPLKLGRSDGRFTEVLGGLKVNDRYVTENSYLIKAEIEKSGASHDH